TLPMNLLIYSLDLFYLLAALLMIGVSHKEWFLHIFLIPALATGVYYVPDYLHWHTILATCATVLLLIRVAGISATVRDKKTKVSRIPEPPRRSRG
ncbi:MAG TPA: hypothetical protein VFK47_08890, partial [Ktedonobacteraceae bacterium]|nr:hypothetical protein [Ktedonobacteraceae bacterium]